MSWGHRVQSTGRQSVTEETVAERKRIFRSVQVSLESLHGKNHKKDHKGFGVKVTEDYMLLEGPLQVAS